jgi:uncharacterized DUF497 family protein
MSALFFNNRSSNSKFSGSITIPNGLIYDYDLFLLPFVNLGERDEVIRRISSRNAIKMELKKLV